MDAQRKAVPSQPDIPVCNQKQDQHMKGNKNTVSCCLHSTELVQPAHLDTSGCPEFPWISPALYHHPLPSLTASAEQGTAVDSTSTGFASLPLQPQTPATS